MSDHWRAQDAYHRLHAKRVSALGAHLSGPQATALVRVIIELNGVAKLEDFTLKVSCEGVEFGGSLTVAPWFAGFTEATYDVRAGKITIFTGAQVEVDSLQLAKGAFKSGIYLTVDKDGIQDIGWRTGPSATDGTGPVAVFEDEIDMTFIGAFDHLTGVKP